MNAWELLPLIREMLASNPECRHREAGELAWLLFSLNYTDDLKDERVIEAAREVPRTDRSGEAA